MQCNKYYEIDFIKKKKKSGSGEQEKYKESFRIQMSQLLRVRERHIVVCGNNNPVPDNPESLTGMWRKAASGFIPPGNEKLPG